jgi:hypothetical protein
MMEATFITVSTSHTSLARIAVLVCFSNFVFGARPGSKEAYTQPAEDRAERFAIQADDDETVNAGQMVDEEVTQAGRHASNTLVVPPRRKRRPDRLDGMYFHDSEKASQLVEREARKIDSEATLAEGKAKNVTAEISTYDKKLKALLKSLRHLAQKQQAYATQVNAEYMDQEYGPNGRLQAFTDFDLQKARPYGDEHTEIENAAATVNDGAAATVNDGADGSADEERERTLEKNLENAESTAKLAQELAKKLGEQVDHVKKRKRTKKTTEEIKDTPKILKGATAKDDSKALKPTVVEDDV